MSISARTLRLAETAYREGGHDASADLVREAAARIDAQTSELEESSRALTLSGKVNKGLMDEVLRLHCVLEKIAQGRIDPDKIKAAARAALQGESK